MVAGIFYSISGAFYVCFWQLRVIYWSFNNSFAVQSNKLTLSAERRLGGVLVENETHLICSESENMRLAEAQVSRERGSAQTNNISF